MKEEIIARILATPLSDWDGMCLTLNGVKFNLVYTQPYGCRIECYDPKIELRGEGLADLDTKLRDLATANAKKIEEESLKSIYDKICIDKEV